MPRHDLGGLHPREQEQRLGELSREAAARPIDFTKSPLLDLSLVHLAPRERVLLVTLPALCADAATLKNLVRELSLVYSARLRGEKFSGDTIQYADIAEWQHELLELEEAASGRSHWREEDLTEPHTLHLPFDLDESEPDNDQQGFAPRLVANAFAAELTEQIAQLAARHNSSAESFLLACWQVLLWRLRPKHEITVGAAYDGRTHETLAEALGPLSKYVPVRSRLEAGFHFKDVWRQVDEGLGRARRWGEYFSWAQPPAGKTGDTIGVPFFPVCFEFAEERANLWTAGDVRFSIVRQEVCFDRFEVKLVCSQRGGALVAELHFDPALIPRAEAERLAERFARLVRSVVESPENLIGELAFVGERELRQLLSEWNQTEVEYPCVRCLHEMFEEQAGRTPDAVALVFEGEQVSYRELNSRANQLAHYLLRQGVGAESLVGVLLERSTEMVVALLGVLKAGGAYVPLDPVNPHERLARILADARITLMLTEAGLGESLSALDTLRIIRLDEHHAAVAREAERNPPIGVAPANLAYVIYTSGSTGHPKGVMISHRAICNRVLWGQDAYPLDASDGVLQNAAFGFDFSVWEIFAPLAAGARLILPRPGGHQDSAYLIDLIKETRVTTAHFVPTMFKILLEEAGLDECAALKRVFCGGEPLPRSLHDRFFERSRATLYNQY
ncbi:MAG TPA: AMP-binding protein, partial [Pyrinomonadaceae bacterium]